MKPILEIKNVSKKFRISHHSVGYLSLRESLLSPFRRRNGSMEDFWALRDVTFDVQPGDTIGIIGRNGAGKSTLLKILSRITPPTTGQVIKRGRIASLLEVGTGFHPELTGRENIFFNGSLLGMRRQEIRSKFADIVDFSGVEKFLDTPLKHYSSGMQLRLAFAVAAFLDPEVLIIDEVLAVGDAEFQKKCLGKMEDVSKSGRTILFVSHNMAAVENLCRRGLLLDRGTIAAEGDMHRVIQAYQASFEKGQSNSWEFSGSSAAPVIVARAGLTLNGRQPNHMLTVSCEIESRAAHRDVFVAFDIVNSIGVTVCQAIPVITPFIQFREQPQHFKTEIQLPPLIPDQYKVSIWLGSHNTDTIFWEKEILGFEITDSPTEGRNFPHSHYSGFVVPHSTIVNA